MCDRERNACLSDASGAHDGHKAELGELPEHLPDERIPADQPRQWRRQVGRKPRFLGLSFVTLDGCRKAITSPWNIENIRRPGAFIREDLPKRRDMHAEIVFVDDRPRPHARDDVCGADDFVNAFDEQQQDFERALTERDSLAVSRERSLFGA
jgi:hypothetical protein